MIDLHCHSHHSDGLLSPAALVQRALDVGIGLLALTDHDTMAGFDALRIAAAWAGLCIVPGIELSVSWKQHDIHILGLNFHPENAALLDLIARQNQRRIARAQAIGERLESIGFENAYQRACDLAGHTRVGRAHYAQLLYDHQMVQIPQQAFVHYLGRGKLAYVSSCWIDLDEAVAVITAAGGQAVIAHPLKYKLTRTKLQELIQSFKHAGGTGIEVVSGDVSDEDIAILAKLCKKFALLASSGSDFHGDKISRIGLGRQKSLPQICAPIWNTWALSN